MSQINPLFLDSTKPIGDKVVTSVELTGIILRDGEGVYLEITDQFGFVQRFQLQKLQTKKSVKYGAEVWLKYQNEIEYRFLIVSESSEVFTSASREVRAGHVISDKWEPCFKEAAKPQRNKRPPRPVREPKVLTEKPLVQPQFFDQIKSLFDDLL